MVECYTSVKSVAEYFDICEETVRRWLRSGKIRGTINSRKHGYHVNVNDVCDYILDNSSRTARFGGIKTMLFKMYHNLHT